MAQTHGYELILLAAGILLPIAVAFRIWRSGLASEYPALMRYNVVAFTSLVAITIALRYTTPETNYILCYVYWASSIVTDCCALAVTLEIFRDIFKPYEALKQLATVLFRWTLGVLVVVSIVSALNTGSMKAPDVISNSLLMFDRGLQILQCGIVFFLLLTNKYLGISFRERVFGIAVGFGLYAAVCLLVLTIVTWVPREVVQPLGAFMNVCGLAMYGIWLVYFYLPQPERRISEALPESRRWEFALASIQAPAPEGLFLSSIDRTVERLLTKNNVATQAKPKEDKHWFGD
jgi:hypothetical protein